jgi:hypothetical protein
MLSTKITAAPSRPSITGRYVVANVVNCFCNHLKTTWKKILSVVTGARSSVIDWRRSRNSSTERRSEKEFESDDPARGVCAPDMTDMIWSSVLEVLLPLFIFENCHALGSDFRRKLQASLQ